jgi:hypothetical protein
VDCEPPAAEPPRRTYADRKLIDELAKRHSKTKDIYSARTVREKPVVIEHEREVEDALRIIERRHFTEDAPGRGLIRHRRDVAEEDVVIQEGGSPAKIQRQRRWQARHLGPTQRSPFSGPTA